MGKIITMTLRIKPYTAFPLGKYEVRVYPDGVVRVWDHIANYYTTCHSLSERTQRRIRKLAAGQ